MWWKFCGGTEVSKLCTISAKVCQNHDQWCPDEMEDKDQPCLAELKGWWQRLWMVFNRTNHFCSSLLLNDMDRSFKLKKLLKRSLLVCSYQVVLVLRMED